ncbi:MAG TPA: hypothetical protein VMA73_17110 [Streptosporangiaceae bacterium]|nr:hypothetical protein [Streptosporangiaceae bacterium]
MTGPRPPDRPQPPFTPTDREADSAWQTFRIAARPGHGGLDAGAVGTTDRVEPLFVTDPFEGSTAASGRGQRVIAAGFARAADQ